MENEPNLGGWQQENLPHVSSHFNSRRISSLSDTIHFLSNVFVWFVKVLMIIIKALVRWTVRFRVLWLECVHTYLAACDYAEWNIHMWIYIVDPLILFEVCTVEHMLSLFVFAANLITRFALTLSVVSFQRTQSIQLYHMLTHRPIRVKELSR